MSRLAVALTLLAGGLVSLHHDTPEVLSVSAPTFGKHRPVPFRAARGVKRLPLRLPSGQAAHKARNPGRQSDRPMSGQRPVRPPATARPAPAGAPTVNWTAIAACESSGDWHTNTGNSYYGGLQMDMAFWHNYGGEVFAARPDLASEAQQIVVAERGLAVQGIGAWPVCQAAA